MRSNLEDARSNLQDTQYDRYISDQKQLLDSLYTDYEIALNERFDNIDALMEDMIAVINANATDSNMALNLATSQLGLDIAANSDSIAKTLSDAANSVGYNMTAEMQNIWNNSQQSATQMSNVVSMYGERFTTEMTTVNSVLAGISANVAAMIAASNKTATTTVKSTTATTTPKAVAKPTTTATKTTTTPAAVQTKPTVTDDTIAKIAEAIWIYGSNATGWGTSSTRIKRIDEKYGSGVGNRVQSYINSKYNSLYANWIKRGKPALAQMPTYSAPKYANGGLIDFTGPAWVDGSSSAPESILSARDTANFIELKEALRAISGNSSVALPSRWSAMNRVDNPNSSGNSIGEINISIPIEHVNDYDDFVAQFNNVVQSEKFSKFIASIGVDILAGKSSLAGKQYKF